MAFTKKWLCSLIDDDDDGTICMQRCTLCVSLESCFEQMQKGHKKAVDKGYIFSFVLISKFNHETNNIMPSKMAKLNVVTIRDVEINPDNNHN